MLRSGQTFGGAASPASAPACCVMAVRAHRPLLLWLKGSESVAMWSMYDTARASGRGLLSVVRERAAPPAAEADRPAPACESTRTSTNTCRLH
jgi:hypothetical protein